MIFQRCSDGVYRAAYATSVVLGSPVVFMAAPCLSAESFDPRFPLGLPEFRPVLGTRLYELTRDFEYVSRDGRHILIHRGFRFDGASIPRFLWPVVGHPMECDYVVGALIHDYLCGLAQSAADRLGADLMFCEVNEYTGCAAWKRPLLWRGVRIGAWWRWTVLGGPRRDRNVTGGIAA